MSMPETKQEMLRAGYTFKSNSVCKGCNAKIEWWKTTNGRNLPFNAIASDHAVMTPHFATCPKSEDFKSSAKPASSPVPKQVAPPDIRKEVRRLRQIFNARVVVVITADGAEAAWTDGIPGEELRQDLISAANFVRNEVNAKQETKRG